MITVGTYRDDHDHDLYSMIISSRFGGAEQQTAAQQALPSADRSTSIDEKNNDCIMKSERAAFVRGPGPRPTLGHSVHATAGGLIKYRGLQVYRRMKLLCAVFFVCSYACCVQKMACGVSSTRSISGFNILDTPEYCISDVQTGCMYSGWFCTAHTPSTCSV